MTNQLTDALPPRDHNEPPLSEIISETLAPFLPRRTVLLDAAANARIDHDDGGSSAEKVINLSQMIRALEKDVDGAREQMKAPYLAAGRAIDREFGVVKQSLAIGISGLGGMLQDYKRKKDAAAEAARQAALAEQRQREEEAERLRMAAEQKVAEGKSGIGDELDAMAAQEAANAAARRAQAIRPEPVRAQLGSLGSRREIAFDIEDARKVVQWMLKQPNVRGSLEQALRTIVGQYLRQAGVDAVQRGIEIPGVKAWIDTQAQVRR